MYMKLIKKTDGKMKLGTIQKKKNEAQKRVSDNCWHEKNHQDPTHYFKPILMGFWTQAQQYETHYLLSLSLASHFTFFL